MAGENKNYREIDFTDPKYNDYMKKPENMVSPTACTNCREVNGIKDTRSVDPGFRYCLLCFDKMKSIGQIVKEFRNDRDVMVMLWEGDPFHRKVDDPINDMFGEGFKV